MHLAKTISLVACGAARLAASASDSSIPYTFDEDTGIQGTVNLNYSQIQSQTEKYALDPSNPEFKQMASNLIAQAGQVSAGSHEYTFPEGSGVEGTVTVDLSRVTNGSDVEKLEKENKKLAKELHKVKKQTECDRCWIVCIPTCIFPPVCAQ